MLGKTHVVSSLALTHASLIGYTAYVNREAGAGSSQLLGLSIGEPLSIIQYVLSVITISAFVLLLLRVGGGRWLAGYLGIMALGLVALLVLFDSPYPLEITLVLLAFTLGSLLPDIDSDTSTIGKYIKPVSSIIPHRTITHTFWVIALIVWFGWQFDSIYLFALALGYTMHIAEDSFSREGICWFYPVLGRYNLIPGGSPMKRGRKPWRGYRTGGFAEILFFYGAIGVHTICFISVVWLNIV